MGFFSPNPMIKGRTKCPWTRGEGKGPILTSPRRHPHPTPTPAAGEGTAPLLWELNPEVLSTSGTESPSPGVYTPQKNPSRHLSIACRHPCAFPALGQLYSPRERMEGSSDAMKSYDILIFIFKISWKMWAMASERRVSWAGQYLPTKTIKTPWCPEAQ